MLLASSTLRNLYKQLCAFNNAAFTQLSVKQFSEKVQQQQSLKDNHVQRTLDGHFGPDHYGKFLCKQFKIFRGSKGKTGNMMVTNDWKWRYPGGR